MLQSFIIFSFMKCVDLDFLNWRGRGRKGERGREGERGGREGRRHGMTILDNCGKPVLHLLIGCWVVCVCDL